MTAPRSTRISWLMGLLSLSLVAAVGLAVLQFDFLTIPHFQSKKAPSRPGKAAAQPVSSSDTQKKRAIAALAQLPLRFEANLGQTDARVDFIARGAGYGLYLNSAEAVLALRKPSERAASSSTRQEKLALRQKVETTVLRMKLLGADPAATATGAARLATRTNYFIGNDPAKWNTEVPSYERVRYQHVYPGIDLEYYGKQTQLEYDFVVAPGADPKLIALGFEGAERIEVNAKGELVMHVSGSQVRMCKPLLYQVKDGVRHEVAGRYNLQGESAGFAVGPYDRNLPLIIDPVLLYSSYLGGSLGEGVVDGVAVDGSGYAYVVGQTASANFPIAPNAYQPTMASPTEAFIAKLDPNQSGSASLLYSSFIGGSPNVEFAQAVAADDNGNAYFTGWTESPNFPVTVGAYDTTFNGGRDVFVTKIDTTKSGAASLVYSTYLGGTAGDEGHGIAIDGSGNAYVCGTTSSPTYPTTANAYQAPIASSIMAFVTKLNSTGSGLAYSTTLRGGAGAFFTIATGIAVDASNYVYVTGRTVNPSFPRTSLIGSGGYFDSFVGKLNPSAATGPASVVYLTMIGGTGADQAEDIAVSGDGKAYIGGSTDSTNFPVTPGAFQSTLSGTSTDAFVAVLDATGSALTYATYFGGSGADIVYAVAVDSSGHLYAGGSTLSANFPLTVDAVDTTISSQEGFVFKLDPAASGAASLLFSTYLGGSSGDLITSIAVDMCEHVYVAGYTTSANFPTGQKAFDTTYAGGGFADAILVKLSLAPPVCTPPPANLVSWWRAEGNANDSADGNNGSFEGGATTAVALVGQGFTFNGTPSQVRVPDAPNLHMTNAMTVEAWIYPTGPGSNGPGGNGGMIVNKEGEYEIARWDDGTIRWALANGSPGWNWINTGFVAPVNQWTHIVWSYEQSSSSIRTYANGLQVHSVFGSGIIGDILPAQNDVLIGGRATTLIPGQQYFQGRLDEVSIYNRALTPAEVLAVFLAGSAGKCAQTNQNPTANAGTDQAVEATSPAGASVSLNGSGSADPDAGDSLAYSWTGPFGTTSGVNPTVSLPLGVHVVTLTVDDGHGGTSSDTVQITVQDTTPPDTMITAHPPAVSNNSGPSFSFGFSDIASTTATYECRLDGGAYGPCSSPQSYSALSEGSHSFEVRAQDASNNTDPSPAFFLWTVDTVGPVISGHRSPAANANGWNNTDVTVTFTCDDGTGSGIATAPLTPQVLSAEGAGQSTSATCTDNAGNSASATVTGINIDKTAPSTSCDAADGAWHGSDVSIACTATDALSGLASSGDAAFSLTTSVPAGSETASATTNARNICDAADNCANAGPVGGNQVDKKAPSISGSRAPAANALGWNNTDVTASFTCADGGSGLAAGSPPADTVLSAEGAGQSVVGTCTDAVGNTTSFTVNGINIDKTAPNVTGTASRPPDSNGWYNHALSVLWSGADTLSGVDSCAAASAYSGPDSASASVSGTCTDRAGNEGSGSLSFQYDSTPPMIAPHSDVTVEASSPSGAVAAYTSPSTTDAVNGAGVASCTPASGSTFALGNTTVTCNASDAASNPATPTTFVAHVVDTTPPSIAVTSPVNGGSYVFGSTVAANYGCFDTVSPIASCVGTVANGANIATIPVGSYSFTVAASDAAGNPSTFTSSYNVAPAPTTLNLTSNNTPSLFGVPVKFTATLSSSAPTALAGGTVTFKKGTTTLGTGTVTGGVATFTTSTLAVGSHSITAEYGGDGNFLPSTSATYTETISPSSALRVTFVLHTIMDDSRRPRTQVVPVEGAEVRVYVRKDQCTDGLVVTGQPKIWGKIFDGLDGPGGADSGCPIVQYGSYVAKGITDANGKATIIVPPTTRHPDEDYVIIGHTDDYDVTRTPQEPDDLYSGKTVENAKAGVVKEVALRRIRMFNGKCVPAKFIEEFGSYLAIIEPEYMDWTNPQELYPIVLVAEGDWTVTTSVAPPEGFVPDTPELSATVANATDAMQFTLTDVGSSWTHTATTYVIQHKGETRVRVSQIPMFNRQPSALATYEGAPSAKTEHPQLKPYHFVGFLAPLVNVPETNDVKPGSAIRFEWQLLDSDGKYISERKTFVSVLSASAACDATPASIPEKEFEAAGSADLKYDAAESRFVLLWKPAATMTGCHMVQITLTDGTKHFARLSFK